MAASINAWMDAVMFRTKSSLAVIASAQPSRLAYGIEEAVNAVGLSRSRLYELIAAGEIAVCKVGRRTIIPATELTAFLERHRVERPTGGEALPPATPNR